MHIMSDSNPSQFENFLYEESYLFTPDSFYSEIEEQRQLCELVATQQSDSKHNNSEDQLTSDTDAEVTMPSA